MIRDTKHFLDQVPFKLQPILRLSMDRFQLGEMSLHGPTHWLNVYRNATALAQQTAGADIDVCQLFALVHDCERRNEGHDPQHGPRAAAVAKELHREAIISISDAQLSVLCEACSHHDRGTISSEPTIGVCWDADRLDLPRVGIRVDKKYLSTPAARFKVAGH